MNKQPKILIYGQPFNNCSGSGITLSNLFKGWPEEKIALAFVSWGYVNISYDICKTYYQIGKEEHYWKFPFYFVKQSFPNSGLISGTNAGGSSIKLSKTGIKQFLSDRVFNPFINWLGITHFNSRIKLSNGLKKWLIEFNPDILYIQVSTLEGIMFARQLIDFLKIPSAIHMMDDWPSTISMYGPLKKIWKLKIDNEFKLLLDNVNLHMSISDAMSKEYAKRYEKHFIPFHNPVDIANYNIPNNKKFSLEDHFRILYIGRIGTANKLTINLFANLISQFSDDHLKIELNIFTSDIDSPEIRSITTLKNVIVRQAVAHKVIPSLLEEHDLLLLPLDFNEKGVRFAKYSIPTKASEYMVSGVPVLVFAPEETAVAKFFSENDCGYCLTSQSQAEIIKAVRFLISNEEYRKRISRNALNLAKEKFDAEKVRERFHNVLANLVKDPRF